jgi:hypothetical protein
MCLTFTLYWSSYFIVIMLKDAYDGIPRKFNIIHFIQTRLLMSTKMCLAVGLYNHEFN